MRYPESDARYGQAFVGCSWIELSVRRRGAHVFDSYNKAPRPQGEELHMALKKLGVPTEFIVYPDMGHGIGDMRYWMVLMQAAEFD